VPRLGLALREARPTETTFPGFAEHQRLARRSGEKNLNPYIPRPLDTSSVALSHSLQELLERLAENTHEVWARERLAQGWSYGSERDKDGLKHPSLVPYGELPESEKEFDRATARETLKAILLLGYVIQDPQ